MDRIEHGRVEPDARHAVRMVRAGIWLSVAGCVSSLVYCGLTPDGPARITLTILSTVSLAATLLLTHVPVESLTWRGSHEPFFLTWSVVLVIDITIGVLIDGGASSPLALALFLPLVFAAMGYRRGSTLLIGALVELAYVMSALATEGPPLGEAVFFAATIATAAGICAWQTRNHERQRDELARLARADPLTGSLNRRGFEERFEAAISSARRSRSSLTLVLIDLDDFKRVNDTWGHAAGDRQLCWVADALGAEVRAEDAAGRVGGDEFAVLLTNDTGTEEEAVRRLRTRLDARVSACFGPASYPSDGETLEELLRAADARLYAAKSGHEERGAARAGQNGASGQAGNPDVDRPFSNAHLAWSR